MPIYCEAQRLTGVPALAIAGLHFREAESDPTRSILSGEQLATVNPDSHVIEGVTRLDNAVRAARHFASGAAEIYGIDVTAPMGWSELAYAAAAYNRGGRYCRADELHPMNSPYVASGLINELVGMRWPDLGSDDGTSAEAWGEPPSVRGQPDLRPGIATFMRGFGSPIVANEYSWDLAQIEIPCR